jgi:hypothetical protein
MQLFAGAVGHGALFFAPALARNAGGLAVARRHLGLAARDRRPVAPVSLRAIERVIGARDQQIDRGCGRPGRDADADCRGDTPAVADDTGGGERCAHALRRNGGFGRGAWQKSNEFLAAHAADDVGGAERLARDLGKVLQHRIAGRMSAFVVDGLEVIEVEGEHADGRHAIPTADRNQAAGGFKESAPVQQPGQRIGCRRHLVAIHRPILRQDQQNDSRADDIEDDFDRKDHDPAARQALASVTRAAKGGERYGKQEDRAVQHRNEDGRPAPDQRLAALAPQLGCGQEGVAGDDKRAHHDARRRRLGKGRKEGCGHPEGRAGRHDGPAYRPAVKRTRPAPSHADGDEQQHRRCSRGHHRSDRVAEPPQHAGGAADQISEAPPRKRSVALLLPGVKQKKPEQDGDANRDKKQRSDIQRCQRCGEIAPHGPKLPTVHPYLCVAPICLSSV